MAELAVHGGRNGSTREYGRDEAAIAPTAFTGETVVIVHFLSTGSGYRISFSRRPTQGRLGSRRSGHPFPPPSSFSASPSPERPPAKPRSRKDGGGGASRQLARAARGVTLGGGDDNHQICVASAGSSGVAAGSGEGIGNEGNGDGGRDGDGDGSLGNRRRRWRRPRIRWQGTRIWHLCAGSARWRRGRAGAAWCGWQEDGATMGDGGDGPARCGGVAWETCGDDGDSGQPTRGTTAEAVCVEAQLVTPEADKARPVTAAVRGGEAEVPVRHDKACRCGDSGEALVEASSMIRDRW
ncbi:hypothetical protein OsJ_27503 [Oryza sativa Japonica Group]|uniref:Uncharacterized protein n=1 Tax=Oryza sativa subsp. japonica TaxID=39947 RepID=A3BTM1_ORYSJ|nr:hypothetical protein OsJ_27503 [Oryza sativa Japonica Group]